MNQNNRFPFSHSQIISTDSYYKMGNSIPSNQHYNSLPIQSHIRFSSNNAHFIFRYNKIYTTHLQTIEHNHIKCCEKWTQQLYVYSIKALLRCMQYKCDKFLWRCIVSVSVLHSSTSHISRNRWKHSVSRTISFRIIKKEVFLYIWVKCVV